MGQGLPREKNGINQGTERSEKRRHILERYRKRRKEYKWWIERKKDWQIDRLKRLRKTSGRKFWKRIKCCRK